MSEIKCPHCGEVFTVDESGYSAIVNQVRDEEFKKALLQREEEIKKSYNDKVKLSEVTTKQENDKEVNELKSQIMTLKAEIESFNKDKALAIHEALEKASEAMKAKEDKITQLNAKIEADKKNNELSLQIAINKALDEQKDALNEKEKEIIKLQGDVKAAKKDVEIKTSQMKESFDIELKNKDDLIAYYKDLKTKMSTKLVGETLEQHCQNQFNQLRMTAFPNAYFEKDNDARTGSKGDYIYRESEDGTEFISIMFEMKNENDTTATKHKNTDFLKELDKDRKEKGCEYAVLVSMLEADSELYNTGIVDVSYEYEKMYVIRPQLFIPMITLLRNAARNSLEYQKQLVEVKNQNLDIAHFEENMDDFKDKFGKHFVNAKTKFDAAIDEIDKTIKELEKVKENLRLSSKHLALANNSAQDLSIKKLTKNAPSLRDKFLELDKEK